MCQTNGWPYCQSYQTVHWANDKLNYSRLATTTGKNCLTTDIVSLDIMPILISHFRITPQLNQFGPVLKSSSRKVEGGSTKTSNEHIPFKLINYFDLAHVLNSLSGRGQRSILFLSVGYSLSRRFPFEYLFPYSCREVKIFKK